MIEIAISNDAAQIFTVTFEDEQLTFRIRHLNLPDRWNLCIERDGVPLLEGQRMVVGTDLFGSFNFKLGGLYCVDSEQTGIDPGRFDLGTRVRLIHISEAEIAAISP